MTMMDMASATDRIDGGGTHVARARRPRRGSAGRVGGENITTNAIRITRKTRSDPSPVICRSGTKFVNERYNNKPSVRFMILDPA